MTLIGAAAMAGVVLAGCGAANDNAGQSSGGTPGVAEPAAPAKEQAPPAEGSAADGDQTAKAPDLSVDQRSIIYTGSITVRVDNVNVAAARAAGFATAAGGFVSADNRNSGDGSDDASLTLRVPADKFSAVVDQLAGLGEEETRGINTEDVTEQTIDLDARIAVQQARVDSGRRLLAQAKSLSDLVMLEREVATRESDLASLQAKKRRLTDLTTLSTITVVLLDPDAALASAGDGPPGFLAGLQGGWKALLASLAVLVTVLGAALPWLIALGLPLWAVIWAVRRFSRRFSRGRPALTHHVPAFADASLPAPPGPQPAEPQGPQPGTAAPGEAGPETRSETPESEPPGRQ